MSNRKLIEQLRAGKWGIMDEAASALEAHEWQPIETIKKDYTTLFDLYADGHGHRYPDCFWGKPTYGQTETWIYESGYDCDGPVNDVVPKPTHWRHAPLPPQPGDKPNE